MNKKNIKSKEELLTRKEALDKLGKYSKYIALTAIGTYMILSPHRAQAQSANPDTPGGGFD